jgi:hypothetical protein
MKFAKLSERMQEQPLRLFLKSVLKKSPEFGRFYRSWNATTRYFKNINTQKKNQNHKENRNAPSPGLRSP